MNCSINPIFLIGLLIAVPTVVVVRSMLDARRSAPELFKGSSEVLFPVHLFLGGKEMLDTCTQAGWELQEAHWHVETRPGHAYFWRD